MIRYDRALRWLLQIDAAILLLAFGAVVMPTAWMQAIHRALGMGDLPRGPIVEYLTRSISLLYALHGVTMLWMSWDVRRYLPLIKCFAVLGMVFGAGMLAIDIGAGMPGAWIVGEGPFLIAFGAVIVWVAGRVE